MPTFLSPLQRAAAGRSAQGFSVLRRFERLMGRQKEIKGQQRYKQTTPKPYSRFVRLLCHLIPPPDRAGQCRCSTPMLTLDGSAHNLFSLISSGGHMIKYSRILNPHQPRHSYPLTIIYRLVECCGPLDPFYFICHSGLDPESRGSFLYFSLSRLLWNTVLLSFLRDVT